MVAVVLRHVQDLSPYYACFAKIAKMLIKVDLTLGLFVRLHYDFMCSACFIYVSQHRVSKIPS